MELMKNGLAKPAVLRIATTLKKIDTQIDEDDFIQCALDGLNTLELKARVNHIITVLHKFLPSDFLLCAPILENIPRHWDHGDPEDALRSFAAWPIIDYIGTYGLDHPQISLQALGKLTSLFSAEFAIRPFLIQHPKYSYQQLRIWATDKNEHLRRLVSEGTRPRLPWGMQLKESIKNPSANIPLLEQLKNDSSLYVRRSVANHLNDISKDHPDKVIKICKQWFNDADKNLLWVIKHATRSLVKSGHTDIFPLLGYTEKIQLAPIDLKILETKIQLGEQLQFQFKIKSMITDKNSVTSTAPQKMVIDFALHLLKANGQKKAKVFKLKSLTLSTQEEQLIEKSHRIKNITTRKYYTGQQKLEILINGKAVASKNFELKGC